MAERLPRILDKNELFRAYEHDTLAIVAIPALGLRIKKLVSEEDELPLDIVSINESMQAISSRGWDSHRPEGVQRVVEAFSNVETDLPQGTKVDDYLNISIDEITKSEWQEQKGRAFMMAAYAIQNPLYAVIAQHFGRQQEERFYSGKIVDFRAVRSGEGTATSMSIEPIVAAAGGYGSGRLPRATLVHAVYSPIASIE